jgi:hypothetical protein
MGDVLDYERGKLGIRRKVRLLGYRNGHAHGAILVEAEKWHAVVKPFGHQKTERVEWKHVQDWPSMNGGPWPEVPEPPPKPMPVIRRMPELTALEHKDLKAMQTPKPTTVPVPSAVAALRGAVDSADLSDLGGLAERIETARKNLAAARLLRSEAEAEEAAAVKVFDDLRATAKKALAMIDAAAGGGV